jgi:hypothetical protein
LFIFGLAIGRVVVLVSPVAAVGVDGVLAENFAGVVVDANAEVVHAAGAAKADLAEAVDVVIADAVVRIAALSTWAGFDGGGIGVGGGGATERPVRPDLVGDAGEGIELGLQFGDGGGGWLGGEPAFQGLVEAF